jgi:hypothetical protein
VASNLHEFSVVMAQQISDCPHHAVIDDILSLAKRAVGWDSEDPRAVSLVAQLRAIALVNSFHDLDVAVPAPAVETSVNGGVALRWVTTERGVEIVLMPAGGSYAVTDRRTGQVVEEGLLEEVEPLQDILALHVVARTSATPGRP